MGWEEVLSCNPWQKLYVDPGHGQGGYVLDEDVDAVRAFNQVPRRKKEHVLRLEAMPEPFVGSVHAPIWLLNWNPTFGEGDHAHDPVVHERQSRALRLDGDPFWMLDEVVQHSGAYQWWNRILASPVREVGRPNARASFFCLELYGYHSERGHRGFRCPSQEFSFQLVRHACDAGKAFVFMRAQRSWTEAVPALMDLGPGRVTRVKNWQRPFISPKNIEDWEIVQSSLVHRP